MKEGFSAVFAKKTVDSPISEPTPSLPKAPIVTLNLKFLLGLDQLDLE